MGLRTYVWNGTAWVEQTSGSDNLVTQSQLGTGVGAFLGTPSSANLASVVTDETGSGALVFGTSPTISNPTISSPTITGPVIDNPKLGYTTQVLAASTVTLTSSSNYQQYFTGSTSGQIVVLPVTSTMALGQAFEINNSSTSISISVRTSDGTTVVSTLYGGSTYRFVCILTSGTTAASWRVEVVGAAAATGIYNGSSVVFNNTPGIAAATLSNTTFISGNFRYGNGPGWTLVTSSGGTTVISTSNSWYKVTGTLAHTLTLPSTSVGFMWQIYNASTGDVTINASAGALVATLKSGQSVQLICNTQSGTTPSAWDVMFFAGPYSQAVAQRYNGAGSAVDTTPVGTSYVDVPGHTVTFTPTYVGQKWLITYSTSCVTDTNVDQYVLYTVYVDGSSLFYARTYNLESGINYSSTVSGSDVYTSVGTTAIICKVGVRMQTTTGVTVSSYYGRLNVVPLA